MSVMLQLLNFFLKLKLFKKSKTVKTENQKYGFKALIIKNLTISFTKTVYEFLLHCIKTKML